MNVVVFSRPFYPSLGGLERVAELISKHLSFAGHDVVVVTDVIEPWRGESVFPFKVKRTQSWQERWKTFRRADRILSMNFSLPAFLIATLLGKRLYVHHGITYHEIGRRRVIQVLKKFCIIFCINIAPSRYVASKTWGPCQVIPNPYDDQLFTPGTSDFEFEFIFCGRLLVEKGADIAIRALPNVLRRYPRAILSVVGQGPEYGNLQRLVSALGLDAHVRFVGEMSGQALVDEMRRHRFMLVPSLWEEQFGIVALEGLACCEKTIVSSRGGLPEAVGAYGLVSDPEPEAFADTMISALDDNNCSEPDIDMLKSFLHEHSPQVVGARYTEILTKNQGKADSRS